MSNPVLSVRKLSIEFKTERGVIRAVDDVSFDVAAGETLGIVGESGCGKTVTSLSLLRLVPIPPGRIVSGSVQLGGRDLLQLSERQMRQVRGREIAMIFQEPMTALNPVFTIANQMIDVITRHQGLNRKAARAHALEMLEQVGIAAPQERIDEYPHQLSGGMRQRVMIAMALSCGPAVLVADEPTTALDVTTQAQVMEQIVSLQEKFGMAMILVTHDLGVIAETCQRALVMYCGRVIEQAPTQTLFANPQHPYTQGLLRSIPRIRAEKLDTLPVIPGTVPDLLHLPAGCRFADRCPRAQEQCLENDPALQTVGDTSVACFFPGDRAEDRLVTGEQYE